MPGGKTNAKRKMMDLTGMTPLPHEFTNNGIFSTCVHCNVPGTRANRGKSCYIRTRLEASKTK